jgi:hypothetical protein
METADLKTKHRFSDCLYWNLFALIPIFTAAYAIGQESGFWLAIYIVVLLGLFLGVEYRYFCTHCPHYQRQGKLTTCMFMWGVPKFFKARQGPLSTRDKMVIIVAFAVAVIFPLPWLAAVPALMVLYLLSVTVFFVSMRRSECVRCIYFDCPLNKVPVEVQDKYLTVNKSE